MDNSAANVDNRTQIVDIILAWADKNGKQPRTVRWCESAAAAFRYVEATRAAHWKAQRIKPGGARIYFTTYSPWNTPIDFNELVRWDGWSSHRRTGFHWHPIDPHEPAFSGVFFIETYTEWVAVPAPKVRRDNRGRYHADDGPAVCWPELGKAPS